MLRGDRPVGPTCRLWFRPALFWFDVFVLRLKQTSLKSLEEPDRRQRGKNKLAQVTVGYIERVVNAAPVAEAANF
jgi:hypothetical protein